MLLQVIYSIGVLMIVATICRMAFVYTYSKQFAETTEPFTIITSDNIVNYFNGYGYIVCHTTRVLNTTKWVAFIIKDGKYQIVTVFTDGNTILGHNYSLV